MLKEEDIELVTIAAPNSLHARNDQDCAGPEDISVREKPLAMDHRGRPRDDCRREARQCPAEYGEELVFTRISESQGNGRCGGFRKIYLIKQSGKTFRPADLNGSSDVNRSGGGASWTSAVTASPSATDFPRAARDENQFYCQIGTMFTPTKLRPTTIRYASSSSLTARPH